ncbi:hypothetical protein Q7F05_16905 [Pseudomonas sp. Lb2C1-1]|uniref:hypothetical protein n=1 Tax=Pseudomonas TaxID=286 RepID=UPI00391B4274
MIVQRLFGTAVIFTLSACSSLSTDFSTQPEKLTPDHRAPVTGQAAKVINTPAGSIHAFSYQEDGKHITCQAPVNLDAQQQPMPQKNWTMRCTHPSIQAAPKQVVTRELSFSADTLFDLNKSKPNELSPLGRQHLEQFVESLRNEYSKPPQLVVTGNASPIGSPQDQEESTLNHAEIVAEFLKQSGISQNLITLKNTGNAETAVNCPAPDTPSKPSRCRHPNRQIKVQVIGN